MRARIALFVFVGMAGCRSVEVPASTETHAALPASSYVTLPRLAETLDLAYQGEARGFIELSSPPDHVMFVAESRRVLVNGNQLSLDDPCMQRGDHYVLTTGDADLVRARLDLARAEKPAPQPRPIAPPLVIHTSEPSGLPAAWRPQAPARHWRYIVIHHMAGASGSAAYIDRLHKQRKWDGLGYHFVVGNGSMSRDGEVEIGYRWTRQLKGAHARARPNDDNRWNLQSIGICLIGDFTKTSPTRAQMSSLVRLVKALCEEYDIPASRVVPHNYVHATKCPGQKFPWDEFQRRIR